LRGPSRGGVQRRELLRHGVALADRPRQFGDLSHMPTVRIRGRTAVRKRVSAVAKAYGRTERTADLLGRLEQAGLRRFAALMRPLT
jgi:hypothetical protein